MFQPMKGDASGRGAVTGYKVSIPARQRKYTEDEIAAVVDVMRNVDCQTQGAKQAQFQDDFAAFVGAKHAFALGNATQALSLAATLCGIKPGDEVIIPAYTFCASAIPFGKEGAKIVWGDIHPDTWVLNPADVERKITPRTKAIVCVHLLGMPCDMPAMMALAQKHGIKVVEDCAQALDARIDGQHVGIFGDFGCFSFHGAKTMSTLGEGGMLTVKSDEDAALVPGIRHNGCCAFQGERKRYWVPAMSNVEMDIPGFWPNNFCIGEALRVLNTMYNNGTLPKGIGTEEDFATMLDWWDNNQTGAISYFVSSGGQYAWTLNDRYKKVNPDATYEDLIVGPMIQAEDGSYPKQYDVPFWLGAYIMIASSCEHPDRALDYLEFLGTTEGQDLIFKGIEGVHYTMDGDKVVFNTEEWKNENVMWGFEDGRCYYPWGSFFYNTTSQWTPWETSNADWFSIFDEAVNYTNTWTGEALPPEVAYGNEITDQNRANVFVDLPSYYALVSFSDDILAIREQLRAIVEEYVPAFITGQKSLDDDWDEYVKKYTDAGLAQVEAAVNDGIAAAKALYDAVAA